jgi:hypothetical protein
MSFLKQQLADKGFMKMNACLLGLVLCALLLNATLGAIIFSSLIVVVWVISYFYRNV